MTSPNWAWCIATYNRHDMLERSCALALSQTAPPAEIVVTDASADWERGRYRIRRLLDVAAEATGQRPRLSYEKASKASLPAQRNESIARTSADVLFLFDDDTLMFPETAERILEVYGADADGVVQAVTAANASETPEAPAWLSRLTPQGEAAGGEERGETVQGDLAQTRSTHPIARIVRKALRADDRFVPYDPEPPVHEVPAALAALDLRSWKLAAGYHLTVRREAALREPFEGRLKGYSPGEDSDATYRLTRHGPILHRPDARIHHAEAPGSRFALFRRVALGATNALLLHRVHSTDRVYSERSNRALLRRRLLIELAKDITNLDPSIPRARGILFALRHVREILRSPDNEVDALFERFQSI